MKRNVSLAEISDGNLYNANDMVKADCHGCKGCSKCCQGMGQSIILDPYDVFRLTTGLGKSMQQLLEKELELNVVDGVILPNLKMLGAQEKCAFLNEEGRCTIHDIRPGICRLFPLGRYYENGSFQYFLQTGECTAPHSKVKVSKWIDTPELSKNTEFINRWHYMMNEAEELINTSQDDDFRKNLNLFILNTFYLAPYDGEADFYDQFNEKCMRYREIVTGT